MEGTMPFRIALFFGFLAAFAGVADGGDLEYGYDALPVMTSDASLIVIIESATEMPSPLPWVQMFRFHVSDRIRGTMLSDQVIAVRSRTTGTLPPPSAARSFAFLSGPLTNEEREDWGITGNEPVYFLVSGKGIVTISSLKRSQSVLDYIALGSPAPTKASLEWALTYLTDSSDRFLQYSAIHQLYRFGGDPEVLNALHNAIKTKVLRDKDQQTAIGVMTSIGTPLSVTLVKSVADNNSLSDVVRQTAKKALTQQELLPP
jgi:hypothetical protein